MQFLSCLAVTLTLAFSMLQCSPASGEKTKNTAAPANTAAAPSGDQSPRISLADAKKSFDDGAAVFVDTRGAPSYQNEHITGAVNISAEFFESKYRDLPADKKIIVYCSCANEHSSLELVARLQQKGFNNASALVGGTPSWKNAGFPLESGEADQQ